MSRSFPITSTQTGFPITSVQPWTRPPRPARPIHLGPARAVPACGTWPSRRQTTDPDLVTCVTCRRTQWFRLAQATAEIAADRPPALRSRA